MAKFSGYNDFRKKRKAAPQLGSQEIKRHSDLLFRLSSSVCAKHWKETGEVLNQLCASLQAYAAYLDKSNEQQKFRQSLNHPVRQLSDNVIVQLLKKCNGPIKACYSELNQALSDVSEYTPVYFDETVHLAKPFQSKMERYRYIEGLALEYSVDVLTYDPGAGMGKTVFIWRVPEERSPIEMMSTAAKVHKSVSCRLPEYHTREMRRDFIRSYQGYVDIPPHVMRAIYTNLTLDATSCQNPAIDARLREAIMTGDPDMAVDLRQVNRGRPDDTFQVFLSNWKKRLLHQQQLMSDAMTTCSILASTYR